jgi:hypothetical protein
MQVHLRGGRLTGGIAPFMLLAALVFLPFALVFALVLLVIGLLVGGVSFLLGRKPRGSFEAPRRTPMEGTLPRGKVLDAEYEVKDES